MFNNVFVFGKYEKQEDTAYLNFERFVANGKRTGNSIIRAVFDGYIRAYIACPWDVSGWNVTGGTEVIELKTRAQYADTQEDCFIEIHKWLNLLNMWRKEAKFPIYINFIGDWKNVYVYYLPMLERANFHPGILIREEEQDRIGLPWEDAYHFQWSDDEQKYNVTKPKHQKKLEIKAKNRESECIN